MIIDWACKKFATIGACPVLLYRIIVLFIGACPVLFWRFNEIDLYHNRLEFRKEDAFIVLEEYKEEKEAVFFIDPPYTAGGKKAGKRLYNHYDLEHEHLFHMCSELKGDFIMTYDNAPEVKELSRKYGFQTKPISMKNTHHAELTELVIGRNLDWMIDINRVLEKKAKYKGKKT